MWLICGILLPVNVLDLQNKKLRKISKLNHLKMTSLLNMVDYEQIEFYAKMVAESWKGTVAISLKAFLVGKK